MRFKASLLIIIVCCFTLLVGVHASDIDSRCVPEPELWITDLDDNPKVRFLIGEPITIHAYYYLIPYTIDVQTSTDGGNTWVHVKYIEVDERSYVGDHADLSEGPEGRMYQCSLMYQSVEYAMSSHFVIPEFIFGSITATMASVVGLILFTRSRKKL